jgi:hypothetical protein
MLAVELTTGGRRVVGVDPAPAMIAVAHARDGGDSVEWIVGMASDISVTDVDLVVMTGNISGYILDDDQWHTTLAHIHSALAREAGSPSAAATPKTGRGNGGEAVPPSSTAGSNGRTRAVSVTECTPTSTTAASLTAMRSLCATASTASGPSRSSVIR